MQMLYQEMLLVVAMAWCCHGEWVVTADEVTARPAEEAGDDWLSWLHLLLAEGQSSPAPETTNKLT